MPTVPSSFVPQVSPSQDGGRVAFQATPVEPIENYAAKQEIEIGQRTLEAGMVMYRGGGLLEDQAQKAIAKREDELNEATAKEADIFALQRMTEIVSGQNGYLRTLGKDAETSYATANDALGQVAQDALARTTNDVQRRMLMPVLARNTMSFQTRMLDHRSQQVKTHYTNESIARSEQYADSAVRAFADADLVDSRTGEKRGMLAFRADVHTALDEINKAADVMGLPADSAQRAAMEQKVRDKITTGVISNLVQRKQYAGADDFLSAQRAEGKIDPAVYERLQQSIEGNRQRTTVDDLTNSILDNGILRSESDPAAYKDDIHEDTAAPSSLRDALDVVDRIKDPDMRRMVKANVRSEWSGREALQKDEYQARLNRVDQFLADPSKSIWDMPADWFGGLNPTDQQKYLAQQRKDDELGAMEELARDPALLTKGWLESNRDRFTPATYTKFLADLNKPADIAKAAYDADMLNASLAASKQTALINPSNDAEREQSALLRGWVKRTIDFKQSQLGRSLTDAEKQKVIDSALLDRATQPAWVWHSKETPIATMSPESWLTAVRIKNGKEVPVVSKDLRDALTTRLKQYGWEVTPFNMYRLWETMGKPE